MSGCGRWAPLPSRSRLGGVWQGVGGCLCWLRARARQTQHAPVRAPRASSPALGAAFAATVCSPGPPPAPSWGFCPLGRSPRGRKTSSKRMPGPVSTATAAGRAGTGRGQKMVFRLMTLPAGGSEPYPGLATRTPTETAGSPSPSPHRREGRRGRRAPVS